MYRYTDGGKLPPYFIFKRKTLPKEKFPDGVIVGVHKKGWMNEDLMQDWIKMYGREDRTQLAKPACIGRL